MRFCCSVTRRRASGAMRPHTVESRDQTRSIPQPPVGRRIWTCFYPRATQGARRRCAAFLKSSSRFLSTRPAGDATCQFGHQSTGKPCFYPRAPQGTRPGMDASCITYHRVSIHAPRRGRDLPDALRQVWLDCFYPRAPQGTRLSTAASLDSLALFLSTRPAGDAT